jgi:hypothetical protein
MERQAFFWVCANITASEIQNPVGEKKHGWLQQFILKGGYSLNTGPA